MIELHALHRRFGPRIAVEHVDLTMGRGEVLGLLGANGAGKTTTLRMLTGHLEPTRGRARVLGHAVADDPRPVRRRLGYLAEGAPLWGELTPAEHLAFCARIHRLDRARTAAARGRLVDQLQLGPVLERRVDTLSRGFRRRVALALALLHDPDVVVLDEPTEGLDPNQKHEVRALLREIAPDRIIVLSTHLLEEVEDLCTRVAVIHEGRIVADATPAALRRRSRWEGALQLRFAGPAPAWLATLPGVASIDGPDADGALVLFPAADAGGALAARVAARVRAEGDELVELHGHRGRLDEVFGALTGRPRSAAP